MRCICCKSLMAFMLALLFLLSAAFIFSNSLKSSEESNKDSDVITKVVEDIAEKIYPENTVDWNYVVRKSAHLTEFFVLGVFTMLFLLQFEWKCRVIYAFSALFLIACTDEFIQRFTGRTSCFRDVVIDFLGASLGVGLVYFFARLKKRRRSSGK